ncbi:hypothetical protein ACFYWN_37290 [Streptomyces sp. NPDC002917]|uniref:hypothetical protein n=1 Tax=Streptomyces sp. NPDC002917 TaxID=3364671 RepID=UPI00367EE67E
MAGNESTHNDLEDEPEGVPDASRELLAQKLRAAWQAPKEPLPLKQIVRRLEDGLREQNIKGPSHSSVHRYLQLEKSSLPEKAVLTELAKIFEVSDEDLAQWHRLQTKAKATQWRRRLQRPVADRPADAPVHDTTSPDGRSQQESTSGEPTPVATAVSPSSSTTGEETEENHGPVPAAIRPKNAPARRGAQWWRTRVETGVVVALGTAAVVALVLTLRPADENSPDSSRVAGPSEPATAGGQVQAGSLGGCRGAIPLAHAPVTGNPCISVIDGQVEVASRIVALQPGKVTVFVWLTDGNIHRPNVQPHPCTFDFAAAGDTQTCSTHVQPDRPGTHWVAATEAKEGWAATLPDGWESFPAVTGTQSGHPLTWPLPK